MMRFPFAMLMLVWAASIPPVSAGGEEAGLRSGKNLIETEVYTLEEDLEILAMYEGLRVADVSDGMDRMGLRNSGLMDPSIHPLWKDLENLTHQIRGIAVTVRYVPNNLPVPGPLEPEPYGKWVGRTYNEQTSEPFAPLLREGSVLVIEDVPGADVGTIGSNNIMSWVLKGCVGVVTGASARDTDEIAIQGVPLYLKQMGRGIRPGRNRVESVNRPVVCGGVLVMPGDVVVADGDGVIVVPRQVAAEVAQTAKGVLEGDKAGRRSLYDRLGLPEDPTVK